MEKILTFTTNTKTYRPSEVEKIKVISESNKTYDPNLTERLISSSFKGYLLSNQNKVLFTQRGFALIYG